MINSQSKTKYFSAKRLATLAVLTAMGLIMFMVESLFPPLFVPGAKMGLSNIFSLLTLFLLGPVDAFVLVIIRTTLGSMFTGNMSTIMYSMSAGIVSVIVSAILVEFAYPKVSIIAVSVVAAVMHNITQNVVFCLISNTPEMFAYLPVLALIGVLAGVIVGFAVWLILRMVPLRTFALVLDGFVQEEQATEQEVLQQTVEQTAGVAEVSTQTEEQNTDEKTVDASGLQGNKTDSENPQKKDGE